MGIKVFSYLLGIMKNAAMNMSVKVAMGACFQFFGAYA